MAAFRPSLDRRQAWPRKVRRALEGGEGALAFFDVDREVHFFAVLKFRPVKPGRSLGEVQPPVVRLPREPFVDQPAEQIVAAQNFGVDLRIGALRLRLLLDAGFAPLRGETRAHACNSSASVSGLIPRACRARARSIPRERLLPGCAPW